ncbi:MAG: hypothetical protein LBK61_07205 [Spirochaetaceae bacterium]|jgi:hypothetical protein|nr:hypothetical protein [Spirochaetaceae bacterium]
MNVDFIITVQKLIAEQGKVCQSCAVQSVSARLHWERFAKERRPLA